MAKREWHEGGCVSCGTDYVQVTTCDRPTGSKKGEEKADFCKYCYGSLAGNAYWWPEHYEGSLSRVVVEVAHILERSILEQVEKMLFTKNEGA